MNQKITIEHRKRDYTTFTSIAEKANATTQHIKEEELKEWKEIIKDEEHNKNNLSKSRDSGFFDRSEETLHIPPRVHHTPSAPPDQENTVKRINDSNVLSDKIPTWVNQNSRISPDNEEELTDWLQKDISFQNKYPTTQTVIDSTIKNPTNRNNDTRNRLNNNEAEYQIIEQSNVHIEEPQIRFINSTNFEHSTTPSGSDNNEAELQGSPPISYNRINYLHNITVFLIFCATIVVLALLILYIFDIEIITVKW